MAISVWGGPLGVFHEIGWYDELLPAFFSFFLAPLFYILGVRLNVLPDFDEYVPQRHRYVGILIVSTSLGFSSEPCSRSGSGSPTTGSTPAT